MTLPVRLNKGDPAPEAGVLVGLYWSGSEGDNMHWRALAKHLERKGLSDTAKGVHAIADAAAAPRPLREGDRVKVGKMTGVIEEIEDDRTGVWVDWEDRAAVSWLKVSWLPIEAVTRIEADHE